MLPCYCDFAAVTRGIHVSTERTEPMRKVSTVFWAVIFAAMLLAPTIAFGQSGEIVGRVTAQDGAASPGATLTITESSTSVKRVARSGSDGYYAVPALMPGIYSVAISSPGYASIIRTGLEIRVEQTLNIDFTLHIGAVDQTVTVSAESPLLETETSSLGHVVSGREVVDLPLLGRDAYALGELVPGVRGSVGMNNLPTDVITTSSVSINGAQATANDFLLDGAPNSAPAFNQPVIYPIADSVQEFRVQTNNYSAEYGRSAGGIYDVVTKGGTNDVHFSAYEFYRNSTLTANNWFAKAAGQPGPPLTFNQFGGVIGGPVVIPKLYNGRNKTFFFIGNEYVRFNQGVTFTGTVPDPTELTGDFSRDVNSAGQPITIYNPFSTTPTGSGYTRTAFMGNNISNYINHVSAQMAKYFPKPNLTTLAGANYVLSTSSQIHENAFTGRVDHIFSDKTSMFARYSYNNTPFVRPNPYGPGDLGGSAYGPQVFDRYNAVIEGSHVFSPTLLGVIRASFARLSNQRVPVSLGFDLSTLGFPAQLGNEIGPPLSFPVVTIAGYSVTGSATAGYTLGETGQIEGYLYTDAIQPGLTKSLGRHELKFGGRPPAHASQYPADRR